MYKYVTVNTYNTGGNNYFGRVVKRHYSLENAVKESRAYGNYLLKIHGNGVINQLSVFKLAKDHGSIEIGEFICIDEIDLLSNEVEEENYKQEYSRYAWRY